ncbi:FCH domain only protein 2 [Aphelenchoides bicaudatus]|nr:FCH domain only protein 2 [Aphelenchoides bicaudatus]
MVVCEDYSKHFWGEQNLGYYRLYANLKRNEDAIQELNIFVKERIQIEDELLKFLNKNLHRVNSFIANKGAFAESWRLTKSTLELWFEIQTTLVKNLSDLSRDILRFHDDMVKSRKRIKDQDTVDAVNLIQTTTTCLQKAKETYLQRCSEMANLKQENANTKELLKVKNKLTKSHEEYKMYVNKYGQVRDNFVEKMQKSAVVFQENDTNFLNQYKTFLCSFARSLDDSQSAVSQVTGDYSQSLKSIDVQAIMLKFVEERGTGTDRPPIINWSDVDDEIPTDFDIQSQSHIPQSAPSSSSSSAVVHIAENTTTTPSVNDLLDSHWGPSLKSESDSEDTSSQHHTPVNAAANSGGSSSYVPSAVSSLFGRQKIAQWRKKQASSQSNLSTAVNNDSAGDFSQSYNESSIIKGGGFLKRYRKSKNSECSEPKNSISGQEDSQSTISDDKALGSKNPLDDLFGPHSLPSQGFVTSEIDAEGYTIRKADKSDEKSKWSSNCSSSEEEDAEEFQTSKIKSLQIKPINESTNQVNSSVDELRNAIGHISLQRSTTFEKDPWGQFSTSELPFSQSLKTMQPMRSAFTGDDSLNRKFSEFAYPSQTMPSPNFDFSQSTNAAMGIARARPRSHTPNAQITMSSSNLSSTAGNNLFNRKESIGGKDFTTPFDNSMSGSFGSLANIAGGWLPVELTGGNHSSSPLSFNDSSAAASRLKIPVAMGINEYIHAWFKSDNSAPVVKVFGVILCSFPASFVSQLTDHQDSREPMRFSLKNANQIKVVQPHKKLITDFVMPTLPQEVLTFTLNKQALANWIFEQQQQKPNAEFYNLDLVRYELDENFEAPLNIHSYWKSDSKQTDLRIDYSLNTTSEKTLTVPLINISFDTVVNGKVESNQSDPPAKWYRNIVVSETNTLSFTLTELTRHGGSSGSLKARLKLNEGPSTPADTVVSFQTSNTTASSVSLQLDNEVAYQLSLVRKKVVSGKYFCKPEIRA